MISIHIPWRGFATIRFGPHHLFGPPPVFDFNSLDIGSLSQKPESEASLISKVGLLTYELSGESVFDTALQESYISGGDIFYAGQWALFVSKISSGGDIGGSSPGGGVKGVSKVRIRGASRRLQTINVLGKNRTIYTGPGGGKFYFTDNGNKVYVNRDETKRKR